MEMTIDQWEATYKPVLGIHGYNVLETYGADWELVQETDRKYVWTWVDGGDYSGYVNGVAFVNRIGYIICENPWDENDDIYVDIYEPYPCEESDEHNWIPDSYYSGALCEWCGIDKGEWEEDHEATK
jgi:hypothetical protein